MMCKIELKKGVKFRNTKGKKCHVVNEFLDDDIECITYKYWNKYSQKWVYKTDWVSLVLIEFHYGSADIIQSPTKH